MDFKQQLPKEVQERLDAYIERIKKINWFKPAANLNKAKIKSQVNLICKAFGVEASLEFKYLKTKEDWDAARAAARAAADILVDNFKAYKEKYPKGNFINLIPLWELGLYPIGVVDGKFLIYIPPLNQEFPEIN